MNNRLSSLLEQMHQLERDFVEETQRKEHPFRFRLRDGQLRFTEAAKAEHKRLKTAFHRYVLHSRFLVIITTPVIWLCAVPILLCDLIGTVYQMVCFPIYGIPKVRRADYIVFDRHHLAYLNFAEKFNCEYCAYVNGILAYFTEIAARTEQHWCPIKHARCAKCAHSRYKRFLDFGDAGGYRRNVEAIRRSFADLESAEGTGLCTRPSGPVAHADPSERRNVVHARGR
jgi:hypothetical protein